MKKVQILLSLFFWGSLLVSAALVALYETSLLEPGLMAGRDANLEFILTITFELTTLASVPLALKLFKFKCVRHDLLTRKASGLLRWGTIRLWLLCGLLFCNTLLYYIFMNTAFGYMSLIIVVCLPFVYPSMDRCIAETEEEVEEKEDAVS